VMVVHYVLMVVTEYSSEQRPGVLSIIHECYWCGVAVVVGKMANSNSITISSGTRSSSGSSSSGGGSMHEDTASHHPLTHLQ